MKKFIAAAALAAFALAGCSSANADSQDAYYACVDVMAREVMDPTWGDPGAQSYVGSDGAWTITGTFIGALGDPIPYTCKATRVSEGRYKVTWE